ncbi:arginyltransferase [uncultured Cohaesibacter sp.]|uniref:arginyltransferase n=1 Tax=uncultured Cohaesibacter sp. TaxID=1002546 RepID=UPI002930991A|nr:arginyltransferase [uncultured Cohaesibacter sp.]
MTQHSIDNPQFYLTSPQSCPYLDDKQERKIFTYLVGKDADHLNNLLSAGGFRRSQTIAYRPACEDCKACRSVRILLPFFNFSRNQKKILNKNRDIIRVIKPAVATSEQYDLFNRYLCYRHRDGGMVSMTMGDYKAMIEETHIDTIIIEYRLRDADSGITGTSRGKLVGVALTDRLDDANSMVYSFFDPVLDRRSLGTFIILDHVRDGIASGLSHLYLGYWIEGSAKMSYKTRFKPLEILSGGGWTRLD